MVYLVDIDGTLARWKHRLHLAGPEPVDATSPEFKDWISKLMKPELIFQDKAIKPTITLVKLAKSAGCGIIYLTSRSEKYREVTELWMRKHRLPYSELIMRPSNLYSSAADYKELHIRQVVEEYGAKNVCALDDDHNGCCAEIYRELGVVHLKVFSND